jgi:hypothetical protein
MDLSRLNNALKAMENNDHAARWCKLIYEERLLFRDLIESIQEIKESFNLKKEEMDYEIEPNEPWLTVRSCCESLIHDGTILVPHSFLAQYLSRHPEYFKYCFIREGKKGKYKVKKEKILQKLVNFPHQEKAQREKIRAYLESREKQ